jgi:hypothetical protein
MKLVGVVILFFAIVGCSTNLPTSPSALDPAPAAIVGGTVTAASAGNNVQKVTVHFYSDEYMGGGNLHIVNLPVIITSFPSGTIQDGLTTGRQGQVSVWVLSTDTTMQVDTAEWGGYCSAMEQRSLPLHGNVDSWILIHQGCF